MNQREILMVKRFYDNKKFPYGFSRSGEFTIAESTFLENRGSYYNAISIGELADLSDDEIRLTKVFRGELQPSSFEENTWLKYLSFQPHHHISLSDSFRPASIPLGDEILLGDELLDDDYDIGDDDFLD